MVDVVVVGFSAVTSTSSSLGLSGESSLVAERESCVSKAAAAADDEGSRVNCCWN